MPSMQMMCEIEWRSEAGTSNEGVQEGGGRRIRVAAIKAPAE